MLRIAICDDSETKLKQTAELVKVYLSLHPGMSLQVEMFSSGGVLPRTAASAFKMAWGNYWLGVAPTW